MVSKYIQLKKGGESYSSDVHQLNDIRANKKICKVRRSEGKTTVKTSLIFYI